MNFFNYREALCLVLLIHAASAFAYEPVTHEKMSQEAFKQSALVVLPEKLRKLGLKGFVDATGDTFPSSESAVKQSILDLVAFGATYEDSRSPFQATRHFYNPVNGSKLLPWIGETSPDWALEEIGRAHV